MVSTSGSTFPLEWQCPQPNSGPHPWGQANHILRTSEFYCGEACLFVCKTIQLPASPPSPVQSLCEGGSSQKWPPLLLIQVPRYQVSAAFRCWELKCGELNRWRHYPIAIVTPLVDSFYFATTAFIAQLFYLKCWRLLLLRISKLAIRNSVMVSCISKNLCHRNRWPSFVYAVYNLLLGWLVAASLSCAQNVEQCGPGCVREK